MSTRRILVSASERRSRFVGASLPARGGAPDGDGVTIAECPATLVQVTARKGRQDALAAALGKELGLTLPAPGGSSLQGDRCAIWLQPGCWLIQAPASESSALARQLARSLAGVAAVVDQSHGRCVLRLSGSRARAVLAKICRLDLHPRSFAVGASATTLVGHVVCTMRLIDETPGFDLIVGSSLATWLLEELVEAADSCGWRLMRAGEEQPV
jgi:sarcosine oxidase subunit gamma